MNEIKEELYQSMLIGDLTISSGTSKEILEYIEKLEKQLQQKENIIKEVRERIMLKQLRLVNEEIYNILHNDLNELLEILDKGE